MSHPILIFGGGWIGKEFGSREEVSDLLKTLQARGITRLDTAARYPPTDPGASERLLGEAGAPSRGFTIDTKVLCSGDGSGSLEPAAIEESVKASHERLQLHDGKINVLYAHRPDPKTPLEEQAAGLNAQYEKGLVNKIGLSNFPPSMLAEFLEICDKKGYVKPSVYQGQYNLVRREAETTLFPILRKHGMTFIAYSPLAGGFLSGRFTAGETEGTRFAEGHIAAQILKAQFDKKEMHDALNHLGEVIKPLGISKAEASLRWLCYHSALGPDDGVILGASKLSQLTENVEAISRGPLPDSVVSAVDNIWRTISEQK
ncbi:uncharacterized protein THITE_2110991 [Thermothielavioides terrestris NRRL 8126]|uniref:NADP-dependent oxidoreductase domain-containing protein n=1 Tax=Thermothielavioides terrestris (strain ATCC 38088 / NRRL 8126) TaxID=578455 RepID=G2QVW7_THETT|nr:uncharacterized protein THITE_2110991 [Thermothielavioides terrestris NRRL 8126]AEO64699.1 hypothetical protein THITE_2110991 [Thermothielavioides terrestris NRRL 8126]